MLIAMVVAGTVTMPSMKVQNPYKPTLFSVSRSLQRWPCANNLSTFLNILIPTHTRVVVKKEQVVKAVA